MKPTHRKNIQDWQIFAWGAFILLFICFCVYLGRNLGDLINADDAAELILAKHLATNGPLISQNWNYSTELRVLYMQWIFTPLFWLSNDWYFVRVTGTIILWLIYLASFYYLCWQLDLQKVFPVLAIFLLFPMSGAYFWTVSYGLYYLVNLTIIFFTIGAILHLRRLPNWRCWQAITLLIILGIITILSGMNGFRLMLTLYLPILIVAVILLLIKMHLRAKNREPMTRTFWQFLIASLGIFTLSFLGLIINVKILQPYFSFCGYGGLTFNFSLSNISAIVVGFLSALGYREGKIFNFEVLLHNVFAAIVILLLLLSIVDIFIKPQKYSFNIKFCGYLFLAAAILFVAFNTVVSLWPTEMDRYWQPVLILILPIIASYVSQLQIVLFIREHLNQALKFGGICVLIIASILCGFYIFRENNYRSNADAREIIAVLQQNDYHNGYGVYWETEILAELSNGALELWCWLDLRLIDDHDIKDVDDIQYVAASGQRKDHSVSKPTGKIFILFSNEENETLTLAKRIQKFPENQYEILYQTQDYLVYGFESYETLRSMLDQIP